MRLVAWRDRAPEEAAHFNPAFCGALVYEFVKEFEKSRKDWPEFPLPFCALPIVMHPDTREILPKSTITGLYPWLEENADAKVGFADRASNLRPYLQEAVRFSISRKALEVTSDGRLATGHKKASFTPSVLQSTTSEVRDTVMATKKVARWFSAAGETSTILAAWGIKI